MRKFKFNMAGLLSLRELNERNAQRELGELEAEATRLKNEMQRLLKEKQEAFSAWGGEGKGSFSPQDRSALSSQIASIDASSKELANSLQSARKLRDDAVKRLEVALREKKVVANLKERRLAEYRAEYYKREAVEIEDAFNARRKVGNL